MIVRDEAAALPRCLASVTGLVREIVAYDTGSTDGTPDILRAAGAIVREGIWAEDFAAARNAALSMVTRPWVLVLDADEVLEMQQPGALSALLTSEQTPRSFVLTVMNHVSDEGQEGAIRRSRAVRLFNRPDLHRWQGCLHEQLSGSVPEICSESLLSIRHWGYQPSVIAARQKNERNRRLLGLSVGTADPIVHELSLCRAATRPELIRAHGHAVLDLSRQLGRGDLSVHAAVSRLAPTFVDAGDWSGLLEELMQAAEQWPFLENQADVWYWLGLAFAGLGDSAGARSALQTAWGLTQVVGVPQYYEDASLAAEVSMALARVCWSVGDGPAAFGAAQRALATSGTTPAQRGAWTEVVAAWRRTLESA